MQVPIVMVFSIFIPSLYKFVTGSRNIRRGEEADGEDQVNVMISMPVNTEFQVASSMKEFATECKSN